MTTVQQRLQSPEQPLQSFTPPQLSTWAAGSPQNRRWRPGRPSPKPGMQPSSSTGQFLARGSPPWPSSWYSSSSWSFATAKISGATGGQGERNCTTSCTLYTVQHRNEWGTRSTPPPWSITYRHHQQRSQWLPTQLPLQPPQCPGQSPTQQQPASKQMHQACRGSIPASESKPAFKYQETQQWPQEHRLQHHYPEAPSSPTRPQGSRASPTPGRDHRPPSPDHGREGQQQPPRRSPTSPRKKEGSQYTPSSPVTSHQITPSPPWRPSKSAATPSPPTASQSCEAKQKILKKEDYCSNNKVKKDSNKFRKIFYMNSF